MLSSCGKDDYKFKPEEPDKSLYFAYFVGEVNGEKFYVENDYPLLPVLSSREVSYSYDGEGVVKDSLDILVTHVLLKNKMAVLRVALRATIGEHLLSSNKSPFGHLDEDRVELLLYFKDESGVRTLKTVYFSREDRPLRANVLSISRFIGGPQVGSALTADLKGALYNKDNPADSIVINATYASQPFMSNDTHMDW
ncbi:MAG: DUF5025 domain-containing protein [Odoribacteraceae bacterium]|jgi:hypothetical protein|nr:DUF5025 domain-containing protein [Odoribacteraceae bacterium]